MRVQMISKVVTSFSLLFAFLAGTVLQAGDLEDSMKKILRKERLRLASDSGCDVRSFNILVTKGEKQYFVCDADTGHETMADYYFRFASNTKVFTAASILLLEQKGLLDINDLITATMKAGTEPYTPTTSDWNIPYKGQITIKQLLQHTAGVFDVDNQVAPGDDSCYVEMKLKEDPNHQFTSSEMVGYAAKKQLSNFEPGKQYEYSDTGYTILGEIIARVYSASEGSSKTYGDFLRDNFLSPEKLNLKSVSFPDLAADKILPVPHTTGYTYDGKTIIERADYNVCAHVAEGNGTGTLTDLSTWIRALFKGQSGLNAAQVEKMIAETSSANRNYSLGCSHSALGYGHTGAMDEGYVSFYFYNPDDDISVAMYTPLAPASEDGIKKEMHSLFYAGIMSVISVLEPAKMANAGKITITLDKNKDDKTDVESKKGDTIKISGAPFLLNEFQPDKKVVIVLDKAFIVCPGPFVKNKNKYTYKDKTYSLTVDTAGKTWSFTARNIKTHNYIDLNDGISIYFKNGVNVMGAENIPIGYRATAKAAD